MKKYISILLCCLLLSALTGCGNAAQPASRNTDQKIKIVASIFPVYDWVRQLIGEDNNSVELTLLLDSGVDLHSYQPTADDIIRISSCDLFLYIGGESDAWVEDILNVSANQNMKILNLLALLGDAAKEEEVVEGMEASHDHEEPNSHAHSHDEDAQYDEHLWLSLKNAQLLIPAIADALTQIDEANTDIYAANAAAYCKKLSELDAQYQSMVEQATYQTLVFGDRFPFRYLVDDYKLSYYAAFVGCSAETEASFETIAFLAEKVDTMKLPAILTLDDSDHKIAQTVVNSTQEKTAQVLVLDSMQATTPEHLSSYLGIMESNLEVLRTALN